MFIKSFATTVALASAGAAAPNYPKYSGSHPGYTGPSVYTPPAPTQTRYGNGNNTSSYPTVYPTSSGSSSSIASGDACATAASLAASFAAASPAVATPTIPAQVAYDCLNSIPFNQSAASDYLNSIDPYLNWQTSLEYVKTPPVEYAEKVQAPYDFFATWNAIKANTSAGAYKSEYEFGWTVYRAFQLAHDGHFVIYPDSVTALFSFGRTTPLVSVSTDGMSAPEPYLYADVLAASFGNASFTPSPIIEIDGQNATEFLLVWSEYGSLQDPDALYNNLFYTPAQIALGSSGTGTGTFSGGGRGRWPFPGASTTLTFANGTTLTTQNYARVLVPLANVTSGADIYETYLTVPPDAYDNAFEVAASSSATSSATATSASASTTSAAATSIPAPGYPVPVVRETNNQNAGYFIDAPGYEDVAVLTINSFVGNAVDEIPFQAVNTYFLQAAKAAGKTKLIIDVSANGGGTILQGYDIFKQLFPSILPYGANRFRAHEALNLLGEQASYIGGLEPRSLSNNQTIQDIQSSAFDYHTDADVNYEPFTSWAEKYGPFAFGPQPDNFTSLIRWNLSDVLTPDNSGGIIVSGYLNRTNITTQPFPAENIIVLYDGYCASTCTIFSELMRQQGGVKTVALGGRPSTSIIQAVGGIKGTNDFPFDYIFSAIGELYSASNSSLQAAWNTSVLADYTQLPLYRSTNYVVNARDGIRRGDADETPLQFVYEAADCRILYTPAMVVDETAVWKTVADTVWGDANACVAGGEAFSAAGNGTSGNVMAKRGLGKRHRVRSDISVRDILDSFMVETEGPTSGADGIMYP